LDIAAFGLIGVLVALLVWCILQVTKHRLSGTLVYFAVSLFVSAFLLFLVQPMIGKMILPRLGGTPQVWNTCMMFFQTVLLAGYAYTHNVTSKLPTKKQLTVHCIVLLLPLIVLLMFGRPFSVLGFGAEGGGNPILLTLALLAMIVGIPFLVVSTTAPLLQRWFGHTGDPAAKDPYFLYGASNAGSILGLLLYPVLIERYLGLNDQAWFWLFGYIVLALLVAGCAYMVFKAPPSVALPELSGEQAGEPEPPPPEYPVPPEPQEPTKTAVTATPPAAPAPAAPRVTTGIRRGGKQRGRGARAGGGGGGAPAPAPAAATPSIVLKKKAAAVMEVEDEGPFEMTPLRRLRWVGLAAVPTSLMLGCTTYISTDISPIPMLWIGPLTLYLLSFVLVFLRWPVQWVDKRNPSVWVPHKICVILQMIAIPAMMFVYMTGGYSNPKMAVSLCWLGFFITALVCHGELAADRPPAKFLTEFYLWMSVGGMLGGTFNALVAPLIPWWGLFEFPLAMVLAGVVRPRYKGEGWTDKLLGAYESPSGKSISLVLDFALPVLILIGSYLLISKSMNPEAWAWNPAYISDPSYMSEQAAQAEAQDNSKVNPLFRFAFRTLGFSPSLAYTFTRVMFIVLTYGLMIGCALLGWKRPIRMGLGLGAVLLAGGIYESQAEDRGGQKVLYRDRSYFGILRVMEESRYSAGSDKGDDRVLMMRYTYLMHGTTHHGLNYHYPDGSEPLGGPKGPKLDLTRLATTYYHRFGPVGAVMEKLNWFPGYKSKTDDLRMTYWGDARLPASLIGGGSPGLGIGLPMDQLVGAWSEPPYATIGLGTGTMASYGRPFQHVTFYEIDEHIRDFSLPPEGRITYFTYLQGALKRGCKLEVIMGDARLTMTKENENKDSSYYLDDFTEAANHKATIHWKGHTSFAKRESYYRAMEVDAFSSDAIPVHLITREAIEMYMDKLMPNGVLCVHTSNRHVNLVQPVLKICEEAKWKDWTRRDANGDPVIETGLKWVVCKDSGAEGRGRRAEFAEPSKMGHFSSEYVLVARKQEYLPPYDLVKMELPTGLPPDLVKKYNEDRIAWMKDKGVLVPTYSWQQDEEYRNKLQLETMPKGAQGEKRLYSSTIDFYTPENIKDSRVNYMIPRFGQTVIEFHGYYVPPGTRTWTDDYSNVLSVFRW
jgi:hypothetical protein